MKETLLTPSLMPLMIQEKVFTQDLVKACLRGQLLQQYHLKIVRTKADSQSLQNSRQLLVRSFQQDQNTRAQSEFEESRKARSRTKSQPSQLVDSYQLVGLESVRKSKAKSFAFSTTNKSLTKPLLSEEASL